MLIILCPECDAQLDLATDLLQGEIIECPDCGSELEIVGLDPVKISVAPEIEEDWGE